LKTLTIKSACFGAAMAIFLGSAWAEDLSQIHAGSETEFMTADGLAAWVIELNPGLAGLEAAAEAAAFRIDPAGSLDDPMLSYAAAPLTAGTDGGLDQNVDFSQKVPWPGTLAAREAAARYEAVAADRDVDALRLQVIAQAKAAYAEWYFVHAALEIHHATKALVEDLIATAETRYAAGQALKQDVLQAEIESRDLDNRLLRLLRLKATVQARINALLNRASDAPLPLTDAMRGYSVLPSLEKLQGLALAQHPELARLDARISAGASRITLAEKAFYPDFQVGVGYNGMWDDPDQRPMLGVSINIPLDRSKRRSDLGRAQADKRHAEWALVERRADLLADLAQAWAEVSEAQDAIANYQDELVPLAAEYLEAALADYQSGSGAFLNVITAEQRKLSTELAAARVRADYVRRLAELERWAGGDIDSAHTAQSGEQQ
jgi:outer membrane protein, heavy metal efflux system